MRYGMRRANSPAKRWHRIASIMGTLSYDSVWFSTMEVLPHVVRYGLCVLSRRSRIKHVDIFGARAFPIAVEWIESFKEILGKLEQVVVHLIAGMYVNQMLTCSAVAQGCTLLGHRLASQK